MFTGPSENRPGGGRAADEAEVMFSTIGDFLSTSLTRGGEAAEEPDGGGTGGPDHAEPDEPLDFELLLLLLLLLL